MIHYAALSPVILLSSIYYAVIVAQQLPLLPVASDHRNVSAPLFAELEELARVVDISYCVSVGGLGIGAPFTCLSRCTEFPLFELVTTWNTGPLLSDSCGYIALDHGKRRVIVAFRGTYSLTNTIVDLSTIPQEYIPYPGTGDDDEDAKPSSGSDDHVPNVGKTRRSLKDEPRCNNCTVHMGFHTSWVNTRKVVLPHIEAQTARYPTYKLNLVGHSLGGAVAALAGLDFLARGWDPTVTTFGEPRLGNAPLARFLDARFALPIATLPDPDAAPPRYRRVTHVNDPVPLLPLTEWGYAMHAGEIHITKPALSPDLVDVRFCRGNRDPACIAGQDSAPPAPPEQDGPEEGTTVRERRRGIDAVVAKREAWGIPSRYRLWELFFAHRDYFWRLGLCLPGGDLWG